MESLQKTGFCCIILALSLMGCEVRDDPTIFATDDIQGKALVFQAVSLIPVPFQWEYAEDATFTKSEEHLSVFAVYRNGSTQKVSLDEIELMLEQTLIDSSPHAFKSPGEKDVALSYGNLSAQYTIIVRSNTETAQGGNGAPVGDTSLTIDIQWK